MEEKLSVKSNAIEVLEKQLYNRAKKKQYGIIVLSSATDPYLHFENEQLLTRHILELIMKYRFPVHVITKSDLVTRDFDLLQQINEVAILPEDLQDKIKQKVFITFSFSSTDNAFSKIFEPGATPPLQRLDTLRETLKAGFHSGVSLMPLLPYISDTGQNLERMFTEFKSVGIKYIFCASLTLFGNERADSKTMVFKAIEKHYPHLLEKYHKFFLKSDHMPAYYTKALALKIDELCRRFGIENGIINSFKKGT
jgi:DNA repair photolyase